MAQFPFLPLWTDAYLGDTRHLSLEEHGAYLVLLMLSWRSPSNSLPDDDARLARMLGITKAKWLKMAPVIRAFFYADDDGLLRQKRLENERNRVAGGVKKAQKAAKARWGDKPLKDNETPHAQASSEQQAKQAPEQCLGDAIQNQNHIQKENTPSVPSDSHSPGVEGGWAFLGDVVRLLPKHMAELRAENPHLGDDAFMASLLRCDAWMAGDLEKWRGRYWQRLRAWLREDNGKAAPPPIKPWVGNFG